MRLAPAAGLVLTNVTFAYGGVLVLDDESLVLPRGGVLVVTGENGVGKSTLLYLCAGLVAAQSGSVTLDGHRPDVLHPSVLFRQGVRRGFVFQQGGLMSNLTALGNVALALRYHADVIGIGDDEIDRRARAALDRVDVSRGDFFSLPSHLSFGVRKRVALARALALEPTFMFFDDPDTGLDAESADLVADILVQCRDDLGVTMVVATNHRSLLERLASPPVSRERSERRGEAEGRAENLIELAGGKLLSRASRIVA